MPQAVDDIQYHTDEGPSLHAMRHQETIHVDDLTEEERWPQFAQRAADETGVMSMLCFRLFADEDTMGALNLYSKNLAAFDEDAERIGAVFAAHAAVALVGAQKASQKDEAIARAT